MLQIYLHEATNANPFSNPQSTHTSGKGQVLCESIRLLENENLDLKHVSFLL
ncbi:hypothetical protein SLEP1_g18339 [Rubroshorea leprosula]|uniref:Uncharacterized protein n=1 Tax=Rubroshorea leprosula TaxID=152421 RepID=A0AAV5IX26_9ROSI|nr:hypothetical protein SLEP1_g18339 [Rubroshorea leprosula]